FNILHNSCILLKENAKPTTNRVHTPSTHPLNNWGECLSNGSCKLNALYSFIPEHKQCEHPRQTGRLDELLVQGYICGAVVECV
ncbi:hypothetical protein M5D96_002328, partial [Drosophila gunungcola]